VPTLGLAVEDLSVARGGRSILHRVSFDLCPGEIVAVIGPNGAGKTSLLEAVLGFLRIESGRVSFAGRELRSLSSRARTFACMVESAEPPAEVRVAVLVEHAIRFGRPPAGLAQDLLDRLGLIRVRDMRPAELSRGERQRVNLFIALCTHRPVVVLDEPLGVFDPLQLFEVLDVLRERARDGTSVLLSVHQLSDAEKIAERILLLDDGRVAAFGSIGGLAALSGAPGGALEEVVVRILRRARARA
jgi:ABC-type multidrug transport system ATPase subunit